MTAATEVAAYRIVLIDPKSASRPCDGLVSFRDLLQCIQKIRFDGVVKGGRARRRPHIPRSQFIPIPLRTPQEVIQYKTKILHKCVTYGLFSQLIMLETDGSNYHGYATVRSICAVEPHLVVNNEKRWCCYGKQSMGRVISGFRREVDELCALLDYYVA